MVHIVSLPIERSSSLKSADSLPRKVSIPAIRDRVTLRCFTNFLCQVFPECKPKHAHPVVSKAIKNFEKSLTQDSFVKLDSKKFYDCTDHAILVQQLRKRIKHDPAISLVVQAITTPTGASDKSEKRIPLACRKA